MAGVRGFPGRRRQKNLGLFPPLICFMCVYIHIYTYVEDWRTILITYTTHMSVSRTYSVRQGQRPQASARVLLSIRSRRTPAPNLSSSCRWTKSTNEQSIHLHTVCVCVCVCVCARARVCGESGCMHGCMHTYVPF